LTSTAHERSFALSRGILSQAKQGTLARVFVGSCSSLWITICVLGVVIVSQRELLSMTSRSEALLPIEENVRAYVITGDRKYLAEKRSIPYPDARRLPELLDDPMIRNILPTSIRPPLMISKSNLDDDTFIPNSWPRRVSNPDHERGWGSFSAKAAAAQGELLRRISGLKPPTDKGTSLEVQDARTNEPVAVVPETRENEY
jgi:hypothetical protein